MQKILRRFRRSESGVAYLEFAMALPFLLGIVMSAVEVSRYVAVHQKLDNAVNTVADVVAQAKNISTGDMDELFAAITDLVEPYSFNTNGRVIISSVGPTSGAPEVKWQYCSNVSSSSMQVSGVGVSGGTATLPSVLTLGEKEDVIVAEVLYEFSPLLFTEVFGTHLISKQAIYRPRLGALDNFSASC